MALVCLIIHTQRAASVPVSEEQFSLEKRRVDGRAAIPLFRGSNLGIFVRKRPFALMPDHAMTRRKETRASSGSDDELLAEFLGSEGHQRRFDDYSENPGPMFG